MLQTLQAHSISIKCLQGSSPQEIAEECKLDCHVVEMLQWDDDTWEASLDFLWLQMIESGLSIDVVHSTKSAFKAVGLTVEDLRAYSKQKLKEIAVPLAARFFFQEAGYCAADQQEHPNPEPLEKGPSSDAEENSLQKANTTRASEDQVVVALASSSRNSCCCRDSLDGNEDQFLSDMRGIRSEGEAATEERNGVVVGGRFDVCFDDKIWYSATVMYVNGQGEGILVYDDDQSVGFISSSLLAVDTDIRCSTVPKPEHRNSLLIAALQCPDDDWHWLIQKYLRSQEAPGSAPRRQKSPNVEWTLEIIAQLSNQIAVHEGNRTKSGLDFTGKILGKGGFGIVVETTGVTAGAMKMEIVNGSPSFIAQPLWRDYKYLTLSTGHDLTSQGDVYQKHRRALKPHVPRESPLFKGTVFAQIYENVQSKNCRKMDYTISLLGMEKLDSVPQEILDHASKTYKDECRVVESARLLAMDIVHVLQKFKAAGVAHCDLKPEHFKYRQEQGGPVLVVIDGSCVRNKHLRYCLHGASQQITRSSGKFVSASLAVPRNVQALPIIGDPARQGTHGYRAPSGAADKSFSELLANDMFSVGVTLLGAVGLVPGRTRKDAEEFENVLYHALEGGDFDMFLKLCPGYRANKKDGGLDGSTIRWFKLCFEMLNLDHANRITPEKALRSSMLLHPNYEEKLFERMCGEGVLVYDHTGQNPHLKPLCLMYSPNHGVIVYRLLNYNDHEQIGRYGGQLLEGDIGVAAYSLHNLSCSGGSILFGAVSKYHSMESFIEACCIGSFFESSRSDPDTLQLGNCYNPERLGTRHQLDVLGNKGLSSIMTYIPMFSKKERHKTRVSWCYSWNAGYGEHQMTQKEIEEKRKCFALPVPSHFDEALTKQRRLVMQQGFTDSWQDPAELDQGADAANISISLQQGEDGPESDSLTQAASPPLPHTSGTYTASAATAAGAPPPPSPPPLAPASTAASAPNEIQPLPDEIVWGLEAADSVLYKKFDWSNVMKDAPVLNQAEQEAAGIKVLPDIPKSRTEFKQALQGQRIVMMDGTSIAIEAAKSLLNTGKEDGLYSRVCDQSQAQAKMRNQAEGGKEQNGAKETKQAGRGRWRQKADSGGGGSKREKKEPHVPCILRVIYAYCIGCGTSFKNIFQTFADGSEGGVQGDNRRRECKGDKWPRPARKHDESRESFLDRMAGYQFLLSFYEIVFYRTVNVLPKKAAVNSSLRRSRTSLLLSDAAKGAVMAQDVHLDMEPIWKELSYTLLMNLSTLMSCIGLVLNSGPNIDLALEFEYKTFDGKDSFNADAHLNGQFRNRYLITRSAANPEKLLSEVMSEKGFKEEDVLRYAWSVYLQAHAAHHPDQFQKMRGVWAEMRPFMLVAFEDRVLHCGPPFPMPFQEMGALDVVQHFRSKVAHACQPTILAILTSGSGR